MRGFAIAIGVFWALLVAVGTATAAEKNVRLVDNLPEAQNATAINFLEYKSRGGRDDDGRHDDDDDDDDDRGHDRDDDDDDDDRGKGRHGDDDDDDRGKDRDDDDDEDDDDRWNGDDDEDLAFAAHRRGKSLDVMLVTGRFGLKTYSLADPANPRLLGEVTAEQLRLPGDPPVDFTPDAGGTPRSTFWQNEDMDVDTDRKIALLSRDPRAYGGTTNLDPGTPNPNNATNIAGVYMIDVRDPRNPQILSFEQLPTGHTTTCINDCEWLWTGGPAATTTQQGAPLNWAGGRPIIVTDLRDPRNPVGHTSSPIDLFRRDGVTAYSHDVQVDDMGIAWVSGDGGTRGYWTEGRHFDPLQGVKRWATPLNPIPYAGGGLPQSVTGDATGGFEHNAWRPVGRDAPKGDRRYKKGELLLATEEDFGPAAEGCANRGQFTIASLAGSYNGEAWRSTAASPFRLQVVGKWSPFGQEGSRPVGGPYHPLANFCSAHYFDVDGPIVSYAWYGEGTRFLDISDPANPRQFAYWRPDDGIVWASYLHDGYVYTADRTRGVDVLKFTRGAFEARKSGREVWAPSPTKKQRRFIARMSSQFKADPGTAGLCYLQF